MEEIKNFLRKLDNEVQGQTYQFVELYWLHGAVPFSIPAQIMFQAGDLHGIRALIHQQLNLVVPSE